MGKVALIPGFRDFVAQADGIGILLLEVLNRRSPSRSNLYGYRSLKNAIDDECTEKIYAAIRKDGCALKIQSLIRSFLGRHRVHRIKSMM